MKRIRKRIPVLIEYVIGDQIPEKGIFEGGVPEPEFLSELRIDVGKDEAYDSVTNGLVSTGRLQVHLRGTPRAYRELSRYLLALSVMKTLDRYYHDHLEGIQYSDGDETVNLVVHAPK